MNAVEPVDTWAIEGCSAEVHRFENDVRATAADMLEK
jgi:hypothetical protein